MDRMYRIGLGAFALVCFVTFSLVGALAFPLLWVVQRTGVKINEVLASFTAHRGADDIKKAVVDAPSVISDGASAV